MIKTILVCGGLVVLAVIAWNPAFSVSVPISVGTANNNNTDVPPATADEAEIPESIRVTPGWQEYFMEVNQVDVNRACLTATIQASLSLNARDEERYSFWKQKESDGCGARIDQLGAKLQRLVLIGGWKSYEAFVKGCIDQSKDDDAYVHCMGFGGSSRQ